MLTGYIQNKQTLTGHISDSSGIHGIITKPLEQSTVTGYIQNIPNFTGHIKSVDGITGIITNMPEQSAKSDHVFVIVDLLQMHEQQTLINSANTILPLTAQNLQAISGQININTVPTTITVNSMTANNISFSAENIMVNEEVYSNANE